jgi:flavin reductase (DIM6/NTAB) family NADH-FMN oxidoreductase RutF
VTEHFYRPADGHGLRHDPLNAIIAPRPIGWIGTRSATGVRNLAPYSFFNAFNYLPPIIGFASTGPKNTLANAEATREFTWNLATRSQAEQMNATSATVGSGVDEYDLAGLDGVPSVDIGADRVAGAPVSFECQVTQIIRLRTITGQVVDSWLILGQVLAVHIDSELIIDGMYDTARAEPIVRGGGPSAYFAIKAEDRFDMLRPK